MSSNRAEPLRSTLEVRGQLCALPKDMAEASKPSGDKAELPQFQCGLQRRMGKHLAGSRLFYNPVQGPHAVDLFQEPSLRQMKQDLVKGDENI